MAWNWNRVGMPGWQYALQQDEDENQMLAKYGPDNVTKNNIAFWGAVGDTNRGAHAQTIAANAEANMLGPKFYQAQVLQGLKNAGDQATAATTGQYGIAREQERGKATIGAAGIAGNAAIAGHNIDATSRQNVANTEAESRKAVATTEQGWQDRRTASNEKVGLGRNEAMVTAAGEPGRQQVILQKNAFDHFKDLDPSTITGFNFPGGGVQFRNPNPNMDPASVKGLAEALQGDKPQEAQVYSRAMLDQAQVPPQIRNDVTGWLAKYKGTNATLYQILSNELDTSQLTPQEWQHYATAYDVLGRLQ